jgi:uncharacterized OsmC-like protein
LSDTSRTPIDRPDFVWRARVSADAPASASVFVRKHSFVVGRPLDFDAEADSVSAVEHLLGALGADVLNGFRAEAKRRRITVDRAEATVEGRLDNPLTHLRVVGETGHPGLREAHVKVYVSSPAAEDAVREAWTDSLERSPLVRTLRPTVALELELQIVA